MFSYLVDDNSKNRQAKGVNKNAVTTSHNGYKDALLNKKRLRHSMNRIQNKDKKIGTYEINNISLSCFANKTYIQNNECDILVLGY